MVFHESHGDSRYLEPPLETLDQLSVYLLSTTFRTNRTAYNSSDGEDYVC